MTFAQLVRKVNTRAAAVAALAFAVVAVPAGLLAWGPSRPTFTMANPAPYVTFNSITDATNYGDERNFVMIQGADGKYTDDVTIENGKEYSVRIYVHNNAASNLNLVARDVVTKLNVPTQTADRIQIDGYVNASNANPTSVWDQAVFHGANGTKFNLSYVAGSAFYKNAVFTSGTPVADSIVSSGAKLGYNAMNGNIPGCFQYSGVVYLKVKATTTDFNLVKTVRKGSTGAFTESVAANPGDTVEYQLYFKNTGGTNQTNVTIKDVLPADMEYIPGTTYVHDSHGTRKVADGVTVGGMTMGSYLPQGDVYIKFAAKVKANDQLDKCGENTLVNTATATTNSGNKSDTANVVATKTCVEPVMIDVCQLSDWKIVRINEKDFDSTKYSRDIANCKAPVMIDVCQLSDWKIVRINEKDFDSTKYSRDIANCKAPVMIDVCQLSDWKIVRINEKDFDSTKYSRDIANCKAPVMIDVCQLSDWKIVRINEKDFDSTKYSRDIANCKAPVMIDVCQLSDWKIVRINEKDFDSTKYSKTLDDCRKITVCELGNKKIVTITVHQYNQYKDRYSTDLNKCKDTPEPNKVQVCRLGDKQIVTISETEYNANKSKYSTNLNDCAPAPEMCTIAGKEHLPKNSPDCKTTPTTPTELPQTGVVDGIMGVFGLGSLAAATSYYRASRRQAQN